MSNSYTISKSLEERLTKLKLMNDKIDLMIAIESKKKKRIKSFIAFNKDYNRISDKAQYVVSLELALVINEDVVYKFLLERALIKRKKRLLDGMINNINQTANDFDLADDFKI